MGGEAEKRGTIPAFAKLTKYDGILTLPSSPISLLEKKELEDQYYIMPGATVLLSASYSEANGPATVKQILDGSIPLNIDVALSYENPGFLFRARHFYSARLKVASGVREPSITFVSAQGD
jgi:hypothetical protein